MKRSRRTRSTSTPNRDVYDDASEQALRSPEYAFGMSEDKVRKVSDTYVPLSLRTGAGRQYWDETFRLLMKIRVECDAAAERLGYASAQDDGLAAVEYIANKILDAVRGERQIAAARNVCFWRLADMPKLPGNVRFWKQSGRWANQARCPINSATPKPARRETAFASSAHRVRLGGHR
jgi:hypothetical protein